MKKITYVASFLAIAGIAFVACKKENLSNPTTSSTTQNQTNQPNVQSRDFVNPYDYVGEIHNIVLNTALLDDSYQALSNENKVLYMTNEVNIELTRRGMQTISGAAMIGVLDFDNQIPDLDAQTTEQYYTSSITSLSNAEKAVMNDLRDYLNQYGVDHNSSQLTDKKKLLEAMVNSTIPTDKQAIMLGAISLGTSSAQYWVVNGEDVTAPYGMKIKPWLADVSGFVSGFGGTVWYNATNAPGDPDYNALTNGTTFGTFCSAVAKLDK